MTNKPLTYKDAGVDIEAGNELVERIKPLVRRTHRPEVPAGLGGFGGLFALPPDRYREPVLVSGTDGVGTKLMLAQQLGQHDTIGIDLVAMCVNDVLVQGAEPLFFLDYFACGKLDTRVAADVVSGIAEGCVQAGAALIGGETAEMPDMYDPGDYDLAGFCVGAVERSDMIDGSRIQAGDALLALRSSGPHSNGYSLIRKVLDRAGEALIDRAGDALIDDEPAAKKLLTPTRIYVRSVLSLLQHFDLKGLAHITGGGITENVPRMLHGGLDAEVETDSWQQGPVFDFLQEHGGIETAEMRRTFNCGVGMVVVIDAEHADDALQSLKELGEDAWRLGRIVAAADDAPGKVRYR